MPPKSRKGWKKKADTLWSQLVRKRDKVCQKCGLKHWQMHPHHVIGRGEHLTRFLPENGVALCPGCHRWAHNHPLAFGDWYRSETARNESYERVSKIAYQSERSKIDYEEVCKELQIQLNRLNDD